MSLATVGANGRPSARILSLKRLEAGSLVFTTGLWTRKAEELGANPLAAAVFHWPALGRQARVEGRAEVAERELAEELFAARPRHHQLQTLASRQGAEIEDLSASPPKGSSSGPKPPTVFTTASPTGSPPTVGTTPAWRRSSS